MKSSNFIPKLITLGNHNDLTTIQDAPTPVADEHYHLSSAQATVATQAASSTLNGYLSNANWNTFNNKQSALTKAIGTDIITGTDDAKYVTSLAITNSSLLKAVVASPSLSQVIKYDGSKWINDTGSSTVLNGSGVPSSGLGINGDFYIDTTGNDIYGPKTGGAWGVGISLKGPQGDPGVNGISGASVTPFISQTTVVVTHNFGSYPAVQILNGSGVVLTIGGGITSITHNSVNAFTVVFGDSTSGNIVATIGGVSTTVVTKTADYTIDVNDNLVLGNASNITFTLPTAVGSQGKRIYVKKINASGNYIRLTTTASQKIDGQSSWDINTQYATMLVISDGLNWYIL